MENLNLAISVLKERLKLLNDDLGTLRYEWIEISEFMKNHKESRSYHLSSLKRCKRSITSKIAWGEKLETQINKAIKVLQGKEV